MGAAMRTRAMHRGQYSGAAHGWRTLIDSLQREQLAYTRRTPSGGNSLLRDPPPTTPASDVSLSVRDGKP